MTYGPATRHSPPCDFLQDGFGEAADGLDVFVGGVKAKGHGVEGEVAGAGRLPCGDGLLPLVGTAVFI